MAWKVAFLPICSKDTELSFCDYLKWLKNGIDTELIIDSLKDAYNLGVLNVKKIDGIIAKKLKEDEDLWLKKKKLKELDNILTKFFHQQIAN